MKVDDQFHSIWGVDDEEWEDSRSKASDEEPMIMAMYRVTVMEGDLSVQSDLLAPQPHPIDEVLESRSWMDDVSSCSRTDDDELRREIERLGNAEKELCQEIQNASAMNPDYLAKNRIGVSGVTIRQLEGMQTDARDSPYWSHPSDEACVDEDMSEREPDKAGSPFPAIFPLKAKTIIAEKTYGSSQNEKETYPDVMFLSRVPPDDTAPVLLASHVKNEYAENDSSRTSSSTGNTLSHDDSPAVALSAFQVEGSGGKLSAELNSTQTDSGNDDDDGKKDDDASTMSEWGMIVALEMPDLETGKKKDLFEEESFWEDGFWKSEYEKSEHNRRDRSEMTDQENTHGEGTSKSSEDDCSEEVSKPKLAAKNQDLRESIRTFPEKFEQQSEDSRSEVWTEIWKPERTFHPMQARVCGQLSSSDDTGDSTRTGDNGDSTNWCSFRRSIIIVAVHLVLIATGLIILVQFLRRGKEPNYQSYQPLENNECSVALHKQVAVNSTEQGTLLGATANQNPCYETDHAMVWYSVLGTGAPIVASTSESSENLFVSVLSGPCSDFNCIGNSESASIVWMSKPEQLYRVLIHGERSSDENFSLSIAETTSSNYGCKKAAMIVIPRDDGNISISGILASDVASNSSAVCDFVSDVGAGAWFSLLGNGKYITASICNGSPAVGETHLRLFSGKCSELECVTSQEKASPAVEPKTSISWVTESGEPYYIAVSSLGTQEIVFELCIESSEAGVSCASSIPADSFAGDSNHIDIFGNIGEMETDVVSSNQYDIGASYCVGDSPSTSVTWYSVYGNGYPMTATTCVDSENNGAAIFELLTGSCDELECIQHGTSASCGASGQQYLSWDTDLGQQYWIVVSGDAPQNQGNYTLRLHSIGGFTGTDEESLDLGDSTDRIPLSVWIYSMSGALFAAFALIAWRWRRLKRPVGELL